MVPGSQRLRGLTWIKLGAYYCGAMTCTNLSSLSLVYRSEARLRGAAGDGSCDRQPTNHSDHSEKLQQQVQCQELC